MKKENNKTEKKETKQIEKLRGIGWRMAMFPAAIVYFEFCFHRQIYGNIDKTIIYPCIFGLLFGMIIAMLTCIFKRIGNAVIGYTMVVIIAFLHIAQAAYYKIFGTFFSFSSISGAHDAMDFVDEVYDALEQNLFFEIQIGVVLFAFALLGIVALSFERPAKKGNIVAGVVTVACIIATVVSLNFGGRNDFSNYSLFHGAFIPELSMNRFGVEVTGFWNTMPTRWRISYVLSASLVPISSTVTVPSDGRRIAFNCFENVVLPEPFLPSSAMNSPFLIVISTPFKISSVAITFPSTSRFLY